MGFFSSCAHIILEKQDVSHEDGEIDMRMPNSMHFENDANMNSLFFIMVLCFQLVIISKLCS